MAAVSALTRVSYFDRRNGSEVIFELNGSTWEVFEREWGGVRWYAADATPDRMLTLARLLAEANGAAA